MTLQETARLTKVPGIGKKTAERLLLELKGKLAETLPGSAAASAPDSATPDILHALVGLGYSEKEAFLAVKALPPGVTVAEGIRQALKALAKS